jgi:hypothetical protein
MSLLRYTSRCGLWMRAVSVERLEGVTRLHALIAAHLPADWADLDPAEAAARVRFGIETDRGPSVQALLATGYQVDQANDMHRTFLATALRGPLQT